MNFSLEKSTLLEAVQGVQGALSNKSTLPVLSGILLEAANDSLSAYATDLEISIKNKVKANVKDDGKAVVFGGLLGELVKNLDDGKVNISLNEKENRLVLKTSKSTFKLNTLPVEDYPVFPNAGGEKTISLKAEDIAGAIRQVTIAASKDESRPILTGIYFNPDKENLSLVATDSYRLSFREIKTPKNSHTAIMVIPRRAAEEVVRTIPKEGTIKVSISEKQVAFESKNLLIISRLIGGQYPNFHQLFPKKHEVEVVVEKEALLQAAKRMATLSATAPLVLKINGGALTISSKNTDVGSGEETIPVKGSNKEVEVAFNPRYLIDGLGTISDDEVALQLTNSQQPGLIKGTKTSGYSYLIMPVRLN